MIEKIEGIILRRVPYLSKSLILDVLTAEGKVPLVLPGTSHRKSAETQVGNLASFVVNRPRGQAMPTVRELTVDLLSADVSRLSPYRSAQLLLLCELTAHTVKGNESGPELYELLYQTIRSLTVAETERFICMRYAYQLVRLLGFAPDNAKKEEGRGQDEGYFDMQTGEFSFVKPPHKYYLTPFHAAPFFALGDPGRPTDFASEKDYLKLWHILMTYFSLHIDGFRAPRSLVFLQELTLMELFRKKEEE